MPLKSHENVCVFYGKLPTYNPQMTIGKPYSAKQGKQSSAFGLDTGRSITTVNNGVRYPLSVHLYNSTNGKNSHPTQKPVALMEYLIKTYTNENETVLDFTMGSGSTGVACKNLNRDFIGIELDENYFNIAQERINEA